MKVFHISGPLQRQVGGPYYTVQNLCLGLALKEDISLSFIGSNRDEELFLTEGQIKYFPIIFDSGRMMYRKSITTIESKIQDFDICHSHGLWHNANRVAGNLARNKRHIVTPRGMLTKWSFNHKRWKKQLAWWLYQKKILQESACIHATSLDEATDLRDMGLTNSIAIIPNGVDLPDDIACGDKEWLASKWPALAGKKILLFMSRIHEKKGLDMLADVWGELSKKYTDWHLVVAGPDQADYWKVIEQKLKKNGSLFSVEYVGPQYGDDKSRLFSGSDLFVLPTYSENFGVAVAESLAYKIPVITTTAAPWQDLEAYNCGWWINPEPQSLCSTLECAMQTDSFTLAEMGDRGRKLVEQKYSWSTISNEIYLLYRWLLGDGDMPASVMLS